VSAPQCAISLLICFFFPSISSEVAPTIAQRCTAAAGVIACQWDDGAWQSLNAENGRSQSDGLAQPSRGGGSTQTVEAVAAAVDDFEES